MNNLILDNTELDSSSNFLSARTRLKIGTIIYSECGKKLLIDKVILKFGECPYCNSDKTFHTFLTRNQVIENVYHVYKYDDWVVKTDWCYDCKEEFIMESYRFEKIDNEFYDYKEVIPFDNDIGRHIKEKLKKFNINFEIAKDFYDNRK